MAPGKHEPAASPAPGSSPRAGIAGRLATLTVVALSAGLALAAPAQAALAPAEPNSPNAEALSVAWYVLAAVVIVLVAAIHAALLGAVARFRGIRGREPARLEAKRGLLARVGAGLGVVMVAILVFGVVITFTARSVEPSGPEGLEATNSRTAQVGVSDVPTADALEAAEGGGSATEATEPSGSGAALEIDVVGQQWLWRFEYPVLDSQGAGQGTDTPFSELFSWGELTVPVDTAVVLNVTSTDVLHTWWVPALGGQVQAVPGKTSRTWFKAEEIGRYPGRSTSFSGSAYPAMRAWVNVVSASDYEAYVAELEQQIRDAQEAVAAQQAAETDTPLEEAAP